MESFFIESLPSSVEFCPPGDFWRLQGVMAELQIVEPRIHLTRLCRLQPPPEIASFFEIEDAQLSNNRSNFAVCGVTIFKQLRYYRQSFSDYLLGLKNWIDFIRSELPNRLLRVYVGNSAWDDLHREGILKARDVDFIRMKYSSSHSKLGQFWRNLVFEDSTIPCRYIMDIDHLPMKHLSMPDKKLKKWCVEPYHIVGRFSGISAAWSKFPCNFFYKLPVDKFIWKPQWVMVRIADLFQVTALNLCAGQLQIPFRIHLGFMYCLMSENTQILYHPKLKLWTKMKENRMNIDAVTVDEHFPFLLSPIIKVKYFIGPRWWQPLRDLFERYPFMRRLYRQLIDEGSVFVSSRVDDGNKIENLIEE